MRAMLYTYHEASEFDGIVLTDRECDIAVVHVDLARMTEQKGAGEPGRGRQDGGRRRMWQEWLKPARLSNDEGGRTEGDRQCGKDD